ncbi:alpha-hydroxy acid oxidase [Aspergillus candidus]|uniref:Oxidase FUB9 n=1 Tax=Aspergillus candidus TaxID=41067 RepID=A0A2I2F3H8_ASPCN|nr:FMN-dependent dehydrogenase family protein [Aspergillus candidus]PLB35138.1 FMN-dependent dehydrogenase family protein [Aspergillus candidus]
MTIPSPVFTIADLKNEAEKRFSPTTREYYNLGADDLQTLHDNESAFTRYRLLPRILRNVDPIDTTTRIFGEDVALPFGFAPTAAHRLAHFDGELATSRAAASNGIPMCLSSWATSGVEDVIAQGQARGWKAYAMQVSFFRDREVTRGVIERAERAGYKAILVSVDLPILGNRLSDSRNRFSFPPDMEFPVLAESEHEPGLKAVTPDPTITWDETIPWLRQHTQMEIWLKGVYTPADTQLAIDHKLDGIIISNHGGRQLDGVPAALDVLRLCAPVARGKIPIAFDGGIRRGADVFKALALGAEFCFVGRVAIWGLAYDGERGVDLAIRLIREELKRTMMLTGCRTIKDISLEHLAVLESGGRLARL